VTAAGERRPLAVAFGLVVAALSFLAWLSQRVERTPDEWNYLLAGRALARHQPLDAPEHRFQGPLILLGTQITDAGGDVVEDPATLRRSRLGMLVFPAVLLLVLVSWARSALGTAAAAWAAFFAATSPTLLAYGPLLSSDVAFAAGNVLASWLAWRWLRSGRAIDLALFGIGLGIAAATKYTAVLTDLALVTVVFVATLRGFDPLPRRNGAQPRTRPRRLLAFVVALALLAALAVATLHAAYLFAVPSFGASPANADALTSSLLRTVAHLPVAGSLLGLLPEPMVLGIDYQTIWAGQTSNGSFLDQRGNHAAYYPVTLLAKTPLVVLALAVGGVLLAMRRGSSATRADRWFWSCCAVPPLVLLGYCSGTHALQMGIRYVLPVVPVLWLLAGRCAAAASAGHRRWRIVLAFVVVSGLATVLMHGPHFIGYFHQLAGGPTSGYRLCADGNLDWLQRHESGAAALRERHADAVFLRPGDGPRFGRVAVYTEDLKQPDPTDATRTFHWLTRFEPIDHDYAAWLVFDVGPGDFEAAFARGDARAMADLGLVHLRGGDFAAAALAFERAAAAGWTQAHERAAVAEQWRTAGDDKAALAAVAGRLAALGHPDLGSSAIGIPRRQDALLVFWLRWNSGRHRDAIDGLEEAARLSPHTHEELGVLATSLIQGGLRYSPEPERARRLLAAAEPPAAGSPLRPLWDDLVRRVDDAIAASQRITRTRR
jgi:hypothetical protein